MPVAPQNPVARRVRAPLEGLIRHMSPPTPWGRAVVVTKSCPPGPMSMSLGMGWNR